MVGGVAINGIAKVGQTLTADVTGITYMPSTTGNVPTFQWYRNGVAITNATGSSYTLTGDDVGAAITVVVSADGVHAAGGVTSTATASSRPSGWSGGSNPCHFGRKCADAVVEQCRRISQRFRL
ncbi:hypothetical protein LJK88_07815 [Paenibacillus sp. P26]|nr:hypothetical protein LJK88_07815 [Paenibacillus sp. P26]